MLLPTPIPETAFDQPTQSLARVHDEFTLATAVATSRLVVIESMRARINELEDAVDEYESIFADRVCKPINSMIHRMFNGLRPNRVVSLERISNAGDLGELMINWFEKANSVTLGLNHSRFIRGLGGLYWDYTYAFSRWVNMTLCTFTDPWEDVKHMDYGTMSKFIFLHQSSPPIQLSGNVHVGDIEMLDAKLQLAEERLMYLLNSKEPFGLQVVTQITDGLTSSTIAQTNELPVEFVKMENARDPASSIQSDIAELSALCEIIISRMIEADVFITAEDFAKRFDKYGNVLPPGVISFMKRSLGKHLDVSYVQGALIAASKYGE